MRLRKSSATTLALAAAAPESLTGEWFHSEYWQAQDRISGSSFGRYTTWFFRPPQSQSDWVLRHYWRGGLMEKFSKDAYFYTGLERTRALAELRLLEQLYSEGLPVPKPIAARIIRKGLWYSADILIERIEDCVDLVAFLEQHPMTAEQWCQLGSTLARFHRRGVYHADLNAKNILIGNGEFYLIDFDRGELRTPASQWQQSNLDRLLRSFNKEKGKQAGLHFSPENWQQLLAGYQAGMGQG
ncbi:3-deoxy-D-manno-octulosonic acid kinase [Shewanella sedimentimangrovi]|uniref:3-deoxy-D-manno-octulosonic acid kinase n=1 Tax=Shewanella sedimentimangrovi TaxID=2814293 RepID=A0ABX7R0R6_9GAMM|nr:3-deoxy-D-manno-octulosonic acid kinase [Shewanella sedimentimangrovi]QSX37382.1 3-deoxy-D-manno-octulosonic acid kinase [Shewanella sedimentimangrovi]